MVKPKCESLTNEEFDKELRIAMWLNTNSDGTVSRYIDEKEYVRDNAKPEYFQWIHDAGRELFDVFGGNAELIKNFKVYQSKKNRDWENIAPDNQLGKDYHVDTLQSIMERQDEDLTDDDVYLMIGEFFHEEVGDLVDMRNPMFYDNVDEDWVVSLAQEKKIVDICIDARNWYRSLPLERRLQRLDKSSYAANLVRRYARNRADWPERFIGPGPENSRDDLFVMQWVFRNENNFNIPLPPALEEYRRWWAEQRQKRGEDAVKFGDKIYQRAQDLYSKLYCTKLNQKTVTKLYSFIDKIGTWPLSDTLEPVTQVEMDTLCDWGQDTYFYVDWLSSVDDKEQCKPFLKYKQGKSDDKLITYPEITLPIDHQKQ